VTESGAPLALWQQQPCELSTQLSASVVDVELPLKPMPSIAELDEQIRQSADPIIKERLQRKQQVRRVVGDGATTSMPLWTWRVGEALLIGHPSEAYSRLQIDLRQRFGPRAVAVMNLVNGSAGYLVPRDLLADQYQAWQSPFGEGAFEKVLSAAQTALDQLTR
jgi:hypothetical protein